MYQVLQGFRIALLESYLIEPILEKYLINSSYTLREGPIVRVNSLQPYAFWENLFSHTPQNGILFEDWDWPSSTLDEF